MSVSSVSYSRNKRLFGSEIGFVHLSRERACRMGSEVRGEREGERGREGKGEADTRSLQLRRLGSLEFPLIR